MSPARMANPNEFDGFSVSELVQSIRQGQEKFAQYTGALQALSLSFAMAFAASAARPPAGNRGLRLWLHRFALRAHRRKGGGTFNAGRFGPPPSLMQ